MTKMDLHSLVGQGPHDAAEVVKVARQPVQRVRDHGVAVADEREHLVQLRPRRVLARGVVGEGALDGDPVELSLGVLIDAGNPDIADMHR